ncbi:hypothetical protein Ahy_B01g056827 [Arachis hypogaea]|uniref:Serine-threonine/tyrosine-protein kinase catalytic domain-containing protein n=1 Tax=Arachis hypogaea TaxID=3818 RepID=A0A445AZT1_ARAHY|nr:hypothetical protein Ahy_B01g056827 [Arachis hypogaea]
MDKSFVFRNDDWLMNEVVPSRRYLGDERNMDDLELSMFDFDTLMMATNNFSQDNKFGEGDFGKYSEQGVEEFKNEVKSIVKIQHRNLIRLLDCCIKKNEKMLVSEYMENRGLDSILFIIVKLASVPNFLCFR